MILIILLTTLQLLFYIYQISFNAFTISKSKVSLGKGYDLSSEGSLVTVL